MKPMRIQKEAIDGLVYPVRLRFGLDDDGNILMVVDDGLSTVAVSLGNSGSARAVSRALAEMIDEVSAPDDASTLGGGDAA